MPLKVYVLEVGQYDRYVVAIYDSSEAAKAAYLKTGPNGWSETGDGFWSNGLDHEDAAWITEHTVQ